MTELRLTTAGESHGACEVCVIEGVPAGLSLTVADVDEQLARRQEGYGRGARMGIEADRCEFAAGVRLGRTIGSPITIFVRNKDHANWTSSMSPEPPSGGVSPSDSIAIPRPGHADYSGMVKFRHDELRPVLERASARETVARVAGGAVCRRLLSELGVSIRGRVVAVGNVVCDLGSVDYARPDSVDWEAVDSSVVACDDEAASLMMVQAVDRAREEGESLGGLVEIWAWGVCPGLGNGTRFSERLDAQLLAAVGSIPAIKGVEIGPAFENARLPGSMVHDPFEVGVRDGIRALTRPSNRAGGIEGGMTNGMPVVLRGAMKPIPTLTKALMSVDLNTMKESPAHVERSDVMAVPAARVVAEAMVAVVLAQAYLAKFGGDSLSEVKGRVEAYCAELQERGLWRRS